MPTFNVKAPDGSMIPVNAPEGATELQAIEFAAKSWKPSKPTVEIVSVNGEPEQNVVPKWGAENPNLYGAYGAGKALLQAGAETLGTTMGAAGGALIPAPGTSVVGAGAGYAAGKRIGKNVVHGIEQLAGENPQPLEPDTAGNVALDVATGSLLQGAGNIISEGFMRAVPQSVIDKLYASSIKMPTTMPGRKEAIATGLKEGAVPTESVGAIGKWLGMKGRQQIVDKIENLDNQVSDIIENAMISGDTVSARAVAKGLDDLLDKGARIRKVDPSYGDAIDKVKKEFLSGSDAIDVKTAQEMKRHIYKVYQDYYGAPDAIGAYIQGKKTLARGLKEQLEQKYPEIASLNMEEGQLLKFLDPFNRAIGRIQNRDIVGLGMQTAPVAGAALSGGASVAAKVAAAAKIIDTPSVKARLAVLLNSSKRSGISPARQAIGNAAPALIIGASNITNELAPSHTQNALAQQGAPYVR